MSTLIDSNSINTLFSNLEKSLPNYVPALPSIRKGLLTTVIVIIIFGIIGARDKWKNSDDDFVSQTRWIFIILAGIFVGTKFGQIVKEKDYTIRCIKLNKQHYSNVHWLKLYTLSLKGLDS